MQFLKNKKANILKNKPRVLVVDDNPKFVESLLCLLKKDYNVSTANNGEEGLFAYKSNPPVSVILLDLEMPGINGIDMLDRIRMKGDSVKTIILTGKSNHKWAARCADLHAHGYMTKPINPDDLIKKINKLLGLDEVEKMRQLLGLQDEDENFCISNSVKRSIKYIHNNYNSYEVREEAAVYLNITADHLSRLLKRDCGITLNKYINKVRINESINCLRDNPNIKIKDLASTVGSGDVNYFCKLFKKETGLTPSEFTRSI